MSGTYGWASESIQDFIDTENEGVYLGMPLPLETSEEETTADIPSPQVIPYVKGYYWWVNTGEIPSNAVEAGIDKDGGKIYVGRALHEGELHPAKVVPNHDCAYISYNGEEVRMEEYEILCKGPCAVIWQECQGGLVPHNAVVGGCTSDNEKLYIGRVFHDGTRTPGKIHPSHGTCYIPYDGEELSFSSYETLVLQ